MPTYVYRCDSCEHQFEIFQRMSEDPLDTCPECGARVRRVIHPVGVVFKGSGWYINDSRSKSSTETTAEKTADKATDAPKDTKETASESKTAKAAEPVKTAAD
jgi:putative FmdB family regulatory protein